MRVHDTLLGVLLLVFAGVFFGYTFTFPEMPGQRFGPALFPRLLATGIAICGLLIAARGWRSGAPWLALQPELRELRGWLSLLAMPLAVVFYLAFAERLGFLPTAVILVSALCAWLGVRWWVALLSGVVSALIVHWFFGQVMRIPLPRGWFMQVLVGG